MLRWYQAHREEYLRRIHEERIAKEEGEHPRKRKIMKWSREKLKEFVEAHGYTLQEPETWEYSPACVFHISKKAFPDKTRAIRLTTFQKMIKT
jgi:hypothetical protein